MIRTPLRVLIYEPYPFGQVAGNLRTLLYILRFTDRQRFRITVVVPFATELLDRLRAHGADVIVLPPPQRMNRYGGRVLGDRWYNRLLTIPDLIRYSSAIYRCLRDNCIDVIYCNGIRALLTVSLAAVAARVPRVWYVKGTLDNPLLDRVGFLLARRVLFFAAANRDDRYPGFVRAFARRIGIIKIGLDLDEIEAALDQDNAPLMRALGVGAEALPIVYVGQLYEPKGVHFLVEAFGRIATEFPAARLVLVGAPVITEFREYERRLRDRVAALGLQDRVVFTGWRSDALRLVSEAAIVVHPSLAEGFGRAVLESMALGRPVVASAVGGLREAIVDGDHGFLVTPGDVEAIAARLRLLLSDPALRARMGSRARERVVEEFRIEDKVAALSAEWVAIARRTSVVEAKVS